MCIRDRAAGAAALFAGKVDVVRNDLKRIALVAGFVRIRARLDGTVHGDEEMCIRDRLYADEHRGHTCGEQKRPAHHRGRRPEREGDLGAGGQCVRGRGGHPMAAGRAEAHQRERRQRVFRKQSEGPVSYTHLDVYKRQRFPCR